MAKSSILPIILLAGGAAVLLTMNSGGGSSKPVSVSKIAENLYFLDGTKVNVDDQTVIIPPANPSVYREQVAVLVRGSGIPMVNSQLKEVAAQMPDIYFTALNFDSMLAISKAAMDMIVKQFPEIPRAKFPK